MKCHICISTYFCTKYWIFSKPRHLSAFTGAHTSSAPCPQCQTPWDKHQPVWYHLILNVLVFRLDLFCLEQPSFDTLSASVASAYSSVYLPAFEQTHLDRHHRRAEVRTWDQPLFVFSAHLWQRLRWMRLCYSVHLRVEQLYGSCFCYKNRTKAFHALKAIKSVVMIQHSSSAKPRSPSGAALYDSLSPKLCRAP